jgi:hypothetical protein
MAIQYKYYGCKFKCGFRRKPNKYEVEQHEEKCWYNKKNKTCVTCANSKINNVGMFDVTPRNRTCNDKEYSSIYKDYVKSKYGYERFHEIYPFINCPNWIDKED